VRAWLATVVRRLCFDQLRSARRRRQHPSDMTAHRPGFGDLAPRMQELDPADRATLADTVGLALQMMTERLPPAERAAFVLHDVFKLSFDDIATVVGRSTAACRQLAGAAPTRRRCPLRPRRSRAHGASPCR
jgi:RNA polymerase sigma-70 factor, ECF subfamily